MALATLELQPLDLSPTSGVANAALDKTNNPNGGNTTSGNTSGAPAENGMPSDTGGTKEAASGAAGESAAREGVGVAAGSVAPVETANPTQGGSADGGGSSNSPTTSTYAAMKDGINFLHSTGWTTLPPDWATSDFNNLFNACKNSVTKNSIRLAACIVRFLTEYIFLNVRQCIQGKHSRALTTIHSIHLTPGEGEAERPSRLWLDTSGLTYLLNTAATVSKTKITGGKTIFDNLSIIESDGKAANALPSGIAVAPKTQMKYRESLATAVANWYNDRHGSTLPGTLKVMKAPCGPANPLSEYLEAHYTASWNQEEDGKLRNPFMPCEVIVLERQGKQYYGCSFGSPAMIESADGQRRRLPAKFLNVPNLKQMTPTAIINGVIAQLKRNDNNTSNLREAEKFLAKLMRNQDEDSEFQPEFLKKNFAQISPPLPPNQASLEDFQRFIMRNFSRCQNEGDTASLQAAIQAADHAAIEQKQRDYLGGLKEIKLVEKAREEVFEGVLSYDIEEVERKLLPLLNRWIANDMSEWVSTTQAALLEDPQASRVSLRKRIYQLKREFIQRRNEPDEIQLRFDRLQQLMEVPGKSWAEQEAILKNTLEFVSKVAGVELKKEDIFTSVTSLALVMLKRMEEEEERRTKEKKQEEQKAEETSPASQEDQEVWIIEEKEGERKEEKKEERKDEEDENETEENKTEADKLEETDEETEREEETDEETEGGEETESEEETEDENEGKDNGDRGDNCRKSQSSDEENDDEGSAASPQHDSDDENYEREYAPGLEGTVYMANDEDLESDEAICRVKIPLPAPIQPKNLIFEWEWPDVEKDTGFFLSSKETPNGAELADSTTTGSLQNDEHMKKEIQQQATKVATEAVQWLLEDIERGKKEESKYKYNGPKNHMNCDRLAMQSLRNWIISHSLVFLESKEPLRCCYCIYQKFPTKSRTQERLDSLKDWSSDSPSKEELAKAGLFSQGVSGTVVCFSCGIALTDWKTGDDAAKAHAALAPDCPFLINRKGKRFIAQAKEERAIRTRNNNQGKLPSDEKWENSTPRVADQGTETKGEPSDQLPPTASTQEDESKRENKEKAATEPAEKMDIDTVNVIDEPMEVNEDQHKDSEVSPLKTIQRKKEIVFTIGPRSEVNCLRSNAFFDDISCLKVNAIAQATPFTTTCLCKKVTVISVEYLTAKYVNQHHGYILSIYPLVCRHFPKEDPIRSDEFACCHGKPETAILTSQNSRLIFNCNQPDDPDHDHYTTTKILKLDHNPSWDASDIKRIHSLREIQEKIHSITSSPNRIRHRMPYHESRQYQLTLNREGVIEEISTGGFSEFRQFPDSRTNPDYFICPSTQISLSLTHEKDFDNWTDPNKTAVSFEAQTTWCTPKQKQAVTNHITLRSPNAGRAHSYATWRRYRPTIPRNYTTIIKASPIPVHPVFDNQDVDFLVDEFVLNESELPSTFLSGSDGGSMGDVHTISEKDSTSATRPKVSSSEEEKIAELEKEVRNLKEKLRRQEENTIIAVVDNANAESTSNAAGSSSTSATTEKTETASQVLDRLCTKGQRLREDNHPPKLPLFDATAMSLKTWVDALLEIFGAYPNLPRGVAVSQVILALREPLLSSFLMAVDADKDKTKTIQALLKEFADASYVENTAVNAQMFARRSQLPDEPAEQYGNALLTLARNAFSKTHSNENLLARVFHRFTAGLREPVGSRVRMQLPKDYKQAVQLANVIEDEYAKGRVNAIEQVKVRDLTRPRYQGRVPANRAMSEKRIHRKPNSKYQNTRTPHTVHGIENREAPRQPDGTDTRRCFKCQRIGHIARHCTNPKPTGSLNGARGSHSNTK